MIIDHIVQAVGNTPCVALDKFAKASGANPNCRLWIKLESLNPGRSIKDRAGIALTEWLKNTEGASIGLESTSGNTGIGLALATVGTGQHVVAFVDDVIPESKVAQMVAFGLEVRRVAITDQERRDQTGVTKRIETIKALCEESGEYIWLNQYGNRAYPDYHARVTGPEIYKAFGSLTAIFASAGTGGTISGLAQYVKGNKIDTLIIAVEPDGSVIFGGEAGPYYQRGSGNTFVPGNYHIRDIDYEIKVGDKEAIQGVETLVRTQGILVGDSTGAALQAAVFASNDMDLSGDILVMASDSGIKYLSDSLMGRTKNNPSVAMDLRKCGSFDLQANCS